MAVGEELLRRYVFIHLEHAADKLQLMLAMVHKLYALVRLHYCLVVDGVAMVCLYCGVDCVAVAVSVLLL
jgi:hypothetical protein